MTAKQIKASLDASGIERDLRSVQRYLDTISQHFEVECDTRTKPYGYRWPAHARGINLPLLSPSEALLIHLAQAELREMLPPNLLKDLNPLLENAQQQIVSDPDANPSRQWMRKVRRIPTSQPLLPATITSGVLETVSNALYMEQKLDIRYRNVKGDHKQAIVWPLGLAQQGTRLYLVCRYEGYDNERILALPRIDEATLLVDRFTYPPEFDLARYEGEGRFAFGEGKPVRLHFWIEKNTGMHLTESPLSSDQVVVEHEDTLEISATVVDSALLHQWIRGWGEAAQNIDLIAL
jgi:predicted DNA-binding transcriptional regulator YafY